MNRISSSNNTLMTISSDRSERTAENTKSPPSKYLSRPESPEYSPIIMALSTIKTCCAIPSQQTKNYLSELTSSLDPEVFREAQSKRSPFLSGLRNDKSDDFYDFINKRIIENPGLFEKAVMEAPDVTNKTILEQLCDNMANDL